MGSTLLLIVVLATLPVLVRTEKSKALDIFMPPVKGCTIIWELDYSYSCQWCEILFSQLMEGLTSSYNPSIVNTASQGISAMARSDSKGTCFINWFLASDYAKLPGIFDQRKYEGYKSNDWFIFVEVARKLVFLDAFEQAIDTDFGNRYPRTVVVLIDPENFFYPLTFDKEHATHSSGLVLAASCFFCPDAESYLMWSTDEKLPWKMLDKAEAKQGYGSAVTTFVDNPFEFGNVIIEDRFRELELKYFGPWMPEPPQMVPAISVLVGAASKHLNFSHTAHKAYVPDPSLITCLRCYSAPLGFGKVFAVVFTTEPSSFVYCRSESIKKKTDVIAALMSPFDEYTWSILLATLILLWFLPGFKWNVISLILSLLGQGLSVKNYRLLTSFFIVALIPLQATYLNYFLSNAVKPFEAPFIQRNQDLFDKGFRIAIYNEMNLSQFSKMYRDVYNRSFSGLKLDRHQMDRYFTDSPAELKIKPLHEQVSRNRDSAAIVVYRRIGPYFITMAESVQSGTRCHLLDEEWFVENKAFYFSGHLAKAAYNTMSRLLGAGLGEMWNSIPVFTRFRRAKKISTVAIDSTADEIAFMNASVDSLLAAYIMLLAINFGWFVMERIFHYTRLRYQLLAILSIEDIVAYWAIIQRRFSRTVRPQQ